MSAASPTSSSNLFNISESSPPLELSNSLSSSSDCDNIAKLENFCPKSGESSASTSGGVACIDVGKSGGIGIRELLSSACEAVVRVRLVDGCGVLCSFKTLIVKVFTYGFFSGSLGKEELGLLLAEEKMDPCGRSFSGFLSYSSCRFFKNVIPLTRSGGESLINASTAWAIWRKNDL
jgi:hypothetical protein